ncbi:MAG: hypothetical protein AAFU03_14940, partial [Bacteroidota bacterium]
SESLGYKFSPATLVRSYRKKEDGLYYEIPIVSIENIRSILLKILKSEANRRPELSNKLTSFNIDLTGVQTVNLSALLTKNRGDKDLMIDWRTSQKLELNAKLVYGITPNLNWVRNHIDEIMNDALANENKYHFILTERKGEVNRAIVEKKIDGADLSHLIQIRSLLDHKAFASFKGITVPIPYDIVIYVDTFYPDKGEENLETIAVTSLIVVKLDQKELIDHDHHQDVRINRERTEELLFWAENIWGDLARHEEN